MFSYLPFQPQGTTWEAGHTQPPPQTPEFGQPELIMLDFRKHPTKRRTAAAQADSALDLK